MLWSKLNEYFNPEVDGGTLDVDGFISYIPRDDYIIEIEDDDGEMFVTDYVQIIQEDNTWMPLFVFQIVADSGDPINIRIKKTADDTIITAKIYKKIDVD